MRELFSVAWRRFGVISSVISDTNARIVSTIFYFTILVPFGIGSALLSDPLRRKASQDQTGAKHPACQWLDRDPVPTDIDSARQQG